MFSSKHLLQILLLLGLMVRSLYSQTPVIPVGSGLSTDPYQISSLGNLYWIAADTSHWSKYYVQTADINAAETKNWFSGSGWTPIGDTSTRSFKGTYNGKGHRIDSLFIKRDSTNYMGLFGYTFGAHFDSIGLTNLNITGIRHVGALVGRSDSSTISNSYSSGSITGVGFNVGGLVGHNFYGIINNCYSSGSVNAIHIVGGLVGTNGGGTISNCYSSCSAYCSGRTAGGLVALNSGTISNSYSSGSVRGGILVGGLTGNSTNGVVTNSFWDIQSSGQTISGGGTGKTTAQMKTRSTYTNVGWDFVGESVNGTLDIWGINSRDNNGYPFLKLQGYKLEQTVSFTAPDTVPNSVTYGNSSFTIKASASSGLPVVFTSSDTSVAAISGDTVIIKGVGSTFISALQNGNTTYYADSVRRELNVQKKTLTTTGITANNKVYDGTTTATLSGGTLIGVISGDDATLISVTGVFNNKFVGTAKTVTAIGYSISGTDASNYTLSLPTGLAADVTAKPLSITGVTAANKVYDGTTGATLSSGTLIGVVSGDNVTLTSGTGIFDSKNIGTAKAVTASGYSISGTDASNYTISLPTGLTADVTAKPLSITGVTAANKVYDGTTGATLSSGTLIGVISGDNVTLISGTGVFDSKNIGTVKAVTASGYSISGTDDSNYTLSQLTGLTADITAAPLAIKANDTEKVQNELDPVFTVTFTGFVPGDDSTLVSGLVINRQVGELPGTYTITPSGATAPNYSIEFQNGTLTIAP